MGRRRRRRVGPTDDWEQLELLCAWEEGVREDQATGALRRAGARAGGGDIDLRKDPLPEDRGLRGGRHAKPLRLASGKRRVLPPRLRRLIVDRARPSAGRASGAQPEQNRQDLLRPFAALLAVLGLP